MAPTHKGDRPFSPPLLEFGFNRRKRRHRQQQRQRMRHVSAQLTVTAPQAQDYAKAIRRRLRVPFQPDW